MDSNELDNWLDELLRRLKHAFGSRLLFVGLVGSHARGEATDASDIDINAVLDEVTAGDLLAYRNLLGGMPGKACGFLCGLEELRAWPRYELFGLHSNCRALHGDLRSLVDMPTTGDIRDAVKISVAAINHEARHRLIYGADLCAQAEKAAGAYKAATFALFAWAALSTGIWCCKKQDLMDTLTDQLDRQVLETHLRWGSLSDERDTDPAHCLAMLSDWSSSLLRRADAFPTK